MTVISPARTTAIALVLASSGCATAVDRPHDPPAVTHASLALVAATASASASTAPAPAPAPSPASAATVDAAAYPWLTDPTIARQTVAAPLAAQIAPPAGMARVKVGAGSFGEWLRGLPLRPEGPVVDYKGRVIVEAGDARVAAVAALDEGTADLQQCADSILRLHAEWRWHSGDRAMSYRAAAGTALPFSRWLGGERVLPSGGGIDWFRKAQPSNREDHGALRQYLDAVFAWTNTGALARDAAKVELDALRPGDFFVQAGSPGHAVLVLDIAQGKGGERALLLGQGYMPAQSFHVLRAPSGSAWFAIDPAAGGVQTPFWPALFAWSSLRRLD